MMVDYVYTCTGIYIFFFDSDFSSSQNVQCVTDLDENDVRFRVDKLAECEGMEGKGREGKDNGERARKMR